MTREQLHAIGMTSAGIAANLDAGRRQALGVHCVVVHAGPLPKRARLWSAVLEAGPRAHLDGESSLVAGGLEHYLWARSDRRAYLVVTMTVQQGLARVEGIPVAALQVRRDRRRTLLGDLLVDLTGGIGSLNELDLLRGCRERGLPEPSGSYYLDFPWKAWATAVEVDGIHHVGAQNLVADALRHHSIAIEGDTVLRLSVLGLRLCLDEFFAQIEATLRRAGGLPAPPRRETSYGRPPITRLSCDVPPDVIRRCTHQSANA